MYVLCSSTYPHDFEKKSLKKKKGGGGGGGRSLPIDGCLSKFDDTLLFIEDFLDIFFFHIDGTSEGFDSLYVLLDFAFQIAVLAFEFVDTRSQKMDLFHSH